MWAIIYWVIWIWQWMCAIIYWAIWICWLISSESDLWSFDFCLMMAPPVVVYTWLGRLMSKVLWHHRQISCWYILVAYMADINRCRFCDQSVEVHVGENNEFRKLLCFKHGLEGAKLHLKLVFTVESRWTSCLLALKCIQSPENVVNDHWYYRLGTVHKMLTCRGLWGGSPS